MIPRYLFIRWNPLLSVSGIRPLLLFIFSVFTILWQLPKESISAVKFFAWDSKQRDAVVGWFAKTGLFYFHLFCFLIQYLAGFEPPTFGPTLSLRRRDILFYFIFPVKNNYCDIFITRTRFIVHRKPKQIVLQNNSLYVEREEEIVTDCVCACVCVCKRLVDR